MYNRYADKAKLFAACLDNSALSLDPDPSERSKTLADRLRTFVLHVQQQLSKEQNLQIARVIYREAIAFREITEIARLNFYRNQIGPVERILGDEGFEEDEARQLASHFVVMALGKWQRRVIFDEPAMTQTQMEEQADIVTQIFLNGITALPKGH